MEKNIFEAFQPNIMERLGECYCQDDSYKQSLAKEKEIAGRLKESLTEEQPYRRTDVACGAIPWRYIRDCGDL